ncbi:MAG: 3-dehydroquinate synthase [Candidatus Eisenbacteria bacterium]|uniref:3-dehydroquinate synthase n=1 Tax=Eiseniibacteriota bacterium TaxID=2212470 RepID=A0A9D6L8C9_UNCEI|nr:3-dehydroquinate synthase [Candidatus Eisenbacteria bacterium]MBI3539520.1 3-dehydroquinate synthase [Candidatus Eisenbacteria bacterium]
MASTIRVRYSAAPGASRIVIARGALDRLGPLVRATGVARAAMIADPHVVRLHGGRALRSLRRAGIAADLVLVPRGERAKQAGVLARVWDRLAALGLGRRDAIVALGGGSVGDLAGFAAATWLRGVAWIGVPTTLLAQVDSSVGGKTAIDLAAGKNLVGAFHQPALVVADPEVLATLPARQRRAGLAEVVKMGFAVDAALFRWCERHAAALSAGTPRALAEAVRRAVAAKAKIVRDDEREREGGARTALNFGHTLGHAIEAALGYARIAHGEAVAIGMRAAARLSVAEAGLAERDRARLETLLDRLHLPRRMPPVAIARLENAMRHDKKRARGVRWVLTPRIGHASVPRPIDRRRMRAAMLEVGAGPHVGQPASRR